MVVWPQIAYWPNKVPAGTVSDHISAFWDILATLSDLTGEPIIGETDGISMLPTLLGKSEAQKNTPIFIGNCMKVISLIVPSVTISGKGWCSILEKD